MVAVSLGFRSASSPTRCTDWACTWPCTWATSISCAVVLVSRAWPLASTASLPSVSAGSAPFAEAPTVAPIAEPTGLMGMLQFTKDDVMYVIELGVMMLLSLVVLFMVIRPLVRRIIASEALPAPPGGDQMPALTDGSAAAGATGQSLVPAGMNQIDVAQVQGQVHAQTVHRVGELAERNPTETASIVRQWLSEPAA